MNIIRIINLTVLLSFGVLYYDLIIGCLVWGALVGSEKVVAGVLGL